MNKLKKWGVLSLVLLLAVSLVYGCAAKYPAPREEAPGGDTGWDYGQKDDWYEEDGFPEEEYEAIAPDSSSPLPTGKLERKFIQDGELSLRSSDIKKTYESLVALTEKLGGRIVSYEQLAEGDREWISLYVAVPFGKLDDFMAVTADEVTRVEQKTVTSEEVTESYYDTKTRIESTEELITHYRTLLTKAETIEDTLRVQSRIDELTLELESLKGRLKLLDSLTLESRIEIMIRQETDTTVTKPEVTWKTLKWEDVGYLMKSAVQKVGIGIVLGVQYFLVFLVYALPFVVLLLLILVTIWLVRRRKKKRRAKKLASAPPMPTAPPEAYRHPVDPQDQGDSQD